MTADNKDRTFLGEGATVCSGSSIEKSNLRFTIGCDVLRLGVPEIDRVGDDMGPIDRRGEEPKDVFIGDRARGGGSKGLPSRDNRWVLKTSIGSGIVPSVHQTAGSQAEAIEVGVLTLLKFHTFLLCDC